MTGTQSVNASSEPLNRRRSAAMGRCVLLSAVFMWSCGKTDRTRRAERPRQTRWSQTSPPPPERPVIALPPPLPKRNPAGNAADDETLWKTAQEFARGGNLEEAMRFFETTPLLEEFDELFREFAERLAREAPDKGLVWLGKLEWNQFTSRSWIAFGAELQRTSEETATHLAPLVTEEKAKRRYLQGVTRVIAEQSPDRAVTFIQEHYPDRRAQEVHVGALITHFYQNPEMVLSLSKQYPAAVDGPTLGEALYAMWKTDPARAQEGFAAMAGKFSEIELYNRFTASFARDDYVAASEWVHTLPRGAARDGSTAALALTIANRFPMDALRLAISIDNEMNRDGSVGSLLDLALYTNEAETRQIIEGSNLDKKEIGKWNAIIGKRLQKN